jgi:hypothetical protein
MAARNRFGLLMGMLLCSFACSAQEFFPNAETASNLPKGVLATSLSNEFYNDVSQFRTWQGFAFTYGLSSQFSLSGTYSFSNHHDYNLPNDFIINSSDGPYTKGYVNGLPCPYSFENFGVEIKWRFLSLDKEKGHFRMAVYTQLAGGNEPHLSAETNLNGDNSGAAAGLVATLLEHKFAISASSAFIMPYHYINQFDSVDINYGNAITYNLSLGYLLLPVRYTGYKQLGINIYMELTGESYNAAGVKQNGQSVNTSGAPSLLKGNYLEARPAVQFIVHSNTRMDVSVAFLTAGHSYERGYPVYSFSIIHSFYL